MKKKLVGMLLLMIPVLLWLLAIIALLDSIEDVIAALIGFGIIILMVMAIIKGIELLDE